MRPAIAIAVGLVALASGCSRRADLASGATARSTSFGGTERSYLVHAGGSAPGGGKRALGHLVRARHRRARRRAGPDRALRGLQGRLRGHLLRDRRRRPHVARKRGATARVAGRQHVPRLRRRRRHLGLLPRASVALNRARSSGASGRDCATSSCATASRPLRRRAPARRARGPSCAARASTGCPSDRRRTPCGRPRTCRRAASSRAPPRRWRA